ncbi:MAG: SRPBCC domain-containing protein [Dehalococcoidia bacterium]|nr:SRPBCC domain-containing protein [Dehalococcoidia bacterium]
MPKYAGEFTVPRSPVDAFDFFLDPQSLVKCVPGVKQYEVKDSDHYSATLQVGVSRIQASLTMNFEIVEKNREAGRISVRGHGAMLGSAVQVEGNLILVEAPDDGTLVKWAGEARLGARLLGVIGAFFEPLVNDNIQSFVGAVEEAMSVLPATDSTLGTDFSREKTN